MARKPRTVADILTDAGLPTFDVLVSNVLAYWSRATPADVESGAQWYGADSDALLADLVAAGASSREHAAVILSHLSPRTTWTRNVAGAYALVRDGFAGARAVGCMADNVRRAVRGAASETPLSTFGPTAHKTASFARNLLGDREAVTVDVWAARVAMGSVSDPESLLKRVGVYAAVADAYREAARTVGVSPETMQATTWIVARNGRAK